MSTDSSHEVTLQPSGWTFPAEARETLLKAARRAGIRLPSSCRNGTCRVCMCRLQSGAVSYVIEWPGLSRDEKEEGWILPCVARAQSALTLRLEGAYRLDTEPTPAPLPLTGARR